VACVDLRCTVAYPTVQYCESVCTLGVHGRPIPVCSQVSNGLNHIQYVSGQADGALDGLRVDCAVNACSMTETPKGLGA